MRWNVETYILKKLKVPTVIVLQVRNVYMYVHEFFNRIIYYHGVHRSIGNNNDDDRTNLFNRVGQWINRIEVSFFPTGAVMHLTFFSSPPNFLCGCSTCSVRCLSQKPPFSDDMLAVSFSLFYSTIDGRELTGGWGSLLWILQSTLKSVFVWPKQLLHYQSDNNNNIIIVLQVITNQSSTKSHISTYWLYNWRR